MNRAMLQYSHAYWWPADTLRPGLPYSWFFGLDENSLLCNCIFNSSPFYYCQVLVAYRYQRQVHIHFGLQMPCFSILSCRLDNALDILLSYKWKWLSLVPIGGIGRPLIVQIKFWLMKSWP